MGRIRVGDGVPERLGLYGLPSGEFVYRVNYARQHPYDCWRFARTRLVLGVLLCLAVLPVGGWHAWWLLPVMAVAAVFALVEIVTEMGDWSARWRKFLRMVGLRWWWTARDLQLQHNVMVNAGGIAALLYIIFLFPACMVWGVLPLVGAGPTDAADWRVLGVWLGAVLYQMSLVRSWLYDTGFVQASRGRASELFRIWVRWLSGPTLTVWLLAQLALGLPGGADLSIASIAFIGVTPALLLAACLPLLLIGEVSLFSRQVIAEDWEYRRAQTEQRNEMVRRALDISEPVLAAAMRERGGADGSVDGLDVLPALLSTLAYDRPPASLLSDAVLSDAAVAGAVKSLAAGYGVDARASVSCGDITLPELRTMLRVVGTVLAGGFVERAAHETAYEDTRETASETAHDAANTVTNETANKAAGGTAPGIAAVAAATLTVGIDGQNERSRRLQVTVHCEGGRMRLRPDADVQALRGRLLALYPVAGHRPAVSIERPISIEHRGPGATGFAPSALNVVVSFDKAAR
ncbi:MAG: hypothetical protein LKI78_02580 [Bifidobacterium tibiigranuli]|jgi:hypothetical protein|nr:hypothetical protein [Bifidobacterium tibiigranuli]